MDSFAIHVENLSKLYRIGHLQQRHDTLRDQLVDGLKGAVRRVRNPNSEARNKEDTIWALKDVSFEVQPGEVVGIIGRNGAGKSTLLKILARITEPTSGRAVINGRVGSLLEVGTGFHPELTGRENIYLNGAILGMRRKEIDRKFDEIVDFAEIEKFLDTPVKRYSSGMYVRLAFAVAAHLETEILLVDEVLAVGDGAFQNKCLGKMENVAKEGRTVLFVSHNLVAVQHLCKVGILIDHGKSIFMNTATETVSEYEKNLHIKVLQKDAKIPPHIIYQISPDDPKRDFWITQIELLDINNQPRPKIYTWDNFKFRIHYFARREIMDGSIVIKISDKYGTPFLLLSTRPDSSFPLQIYLGYNYADCEIFQIPFSGGEYIIGSGLAIPNKEWLCWDDELAIFTIHAKDVYQSGLAPTTSRSLLAIPHKWDKL